MVKRFIRDLSVERADMLCHLEGYQIESVLDVGCSYGYAVRQFMRRLPKARVVGVDCSKEAIDTAHSLTSRKLELHVARAEDLPFGGGEFAWVYCAHTLEHTPDIPVAVAELCRVSSKGIFVVVPFEGDITWEYRQKESAGSPDDHKFHTKDTFEWLDFFRGRGLQMRACQFTPRNDFIMVFIKEDALAPYGGRWQEGYDEGRLVRRLGEEERLGAERGTNL